MREKAAGRRRRALPSRERQLALAVFACVADELDIPHYDGRALTPAVFDAAPAAVRGAWTAHRMAKAFGGSWAAAVTALASDWDDAPLADEREAPAGHGALVARNLGLRRDAQRMPIEELAQLADVPAPLLAALEAGQRPLVPFVEMARIARALGVALDVFLAPVDAEHAARS